MFEKVKEAWGQTFPNEPFTLTKDALEDAIIGHPEFGPAYVTMSEAEKEVYIDAHMAEILHMLFESTNQNTGVTGVATTGEKKKAIEPESYLRLSDARKRVVEAALAQNADLKRARSIQSTIDAVLIAKDCPTEWMAGAPACPLKEGNAAAKNVEAPAVNGSVLDWLKGAQDKAIMVPTNAQLAELAKEHKERWIANNPTKADKYKAPAWATCDNDADVAAVREALASGAPMQVLVTGKEDDPTTHAKGWRWSTKGYVVTFPTGLDGEGGTTTKNMSLIGFRNWLLNETTGAILTDKDDKSALSAKILMTKPRMSKNAPGVQLPTHSLRVRGNNPSNPNVVLKPVTAPKAGATTKMVVKSALSFLIVRASRPEGGDPTAATNYRVVRQRLSLVWAEAPQFELLPEYAAVPHLNVGRGASSKKQLSKQEKKSVGDAMRNLYAALLSGEMSDEAVAEQGLTEVKQALNEQAAKIAQQDAANFG